MFSKFKFPTLVIIDYYDEKDIFCLIPAWDSKARIAIPVSTVPQKILDNIDHKYWYARCNLGASTRAELDICFEQNIRMKQVEGVS